MGNMTEEKFHSSINYVINRPVRFYKKYLQLG